MPDNPKPIKFDKKFLKNLKKRFIGDKKLERQIQKRIDLFLEDKGNPLLKDHKLLGTMRGLRSFSVTGDVRIVYQEFEDFYLFIDVGTHNQIY